MVERAASLTPWLKGLALTPVKFGISFTRRTLNQANALVNIYLDGTIQVSTGGTEMGQGLNTKIRQLVADQFALPVEAVTVMPTSTEKNNNTSPTAASASTDLNGRAAVRACEALAAAARRGGRAAPGVARARGSSRRRVDVGFEEGGVFDRRRPALRLGFGDLVRLAYEERVDLGDRGFYATPGVDFNRETGQGNPFLYYTNGCAVAEVLIDRLTGEVKVTRVDILMDIGRSINPAIDRGQVIGGFVQGMGWATTEELRYSDAGELLTHSPTTYKVPNVTDLPPLFAVDFLENRENSINVYGSKAVGEPPFLLGVAVWAAVKHALSFVSQPPICLGEDKGTGKQRTRLNLPATNEEVMRCLGGVREARSRSLGIDNHPLWELFHECRRISCDWRSKDQEGIAAGQSPFGSVIVTGGEVVAVTHNTVWRRHRPDGPRRGQLHPRGGDGPQDDRPRRLHALFDDASRARCACRRSTGRRSTAWSSAPPSPTPPRRASASCTSPPRCSPRWAGARSRSRAACSARSAPSCSSEWKRPAKPDRIKGFVRDAHDLAPRDRGRRRPGTASRATDPRGPRPGAGRPAADRRAGRQRLHPSGSRPADVVIADGWIAGVGRVQLGGRETIDARGRPSSPG